MIDDKTKTCADMYAIIDSFKIDWNKVRGGKRWFIDMIPNCLSEMFTHGEVSEDFYNENNFPVDRDHEGKKWHLKSAADHLTRSKVLYHPTVIAKKQDVILTCMAAKNAKQLKIRDEANDVLEQNKDCEQAIITMVKDTKDCNNMSNIDILSSASLAIFSSLNVVMLSSFYKARYLNDLTQKLILPNKGTFEKVQYKKKDKKINGPYLIQLSYDTKLLPVIGTIPVMKAIELPTMLVKPPTVLRFETSNQTIVQEKIDLT